MKNTKKKEIAARLAKAAALLFSVPADTGSIRDRERDTAAPKKRSRLLKGLKP